MSSRVASLFCSLAVLTLACACGGSHTPSDALPTNTATRSESPGPSAAAAGTSPAQGRSSATHKDPVGDVVTWDAEGSGAEAVQSSGHPYIDVVRTRFRHGDRVRIGISFVDLQPTRDSGGMLTFQLDAFVATSTRSPHVVQLREGSDGRVKLTLWKLDDGQERVRCALSHTFDYQHNLARIDLPRECLGNPEWVRLGATASGYLTEHEFAEEFGEDVAQKDGYEFAALPPLSPRLYRG